MDASAVRFAKTMKATNGKPRPFVPRGLSEPLSAYEAE